jgi:hypothetical protein
LEQLLGKTGIEGCATATARAAYAAEAGAHGSIPREAGTTLRRSVRTAIMRRHHFHILDRSMAIPLVVLNPEIGKLHVSVVHRQVMDMGPTLDFLGVSIRTSIAVSTSPIRLLEEALIVALQLIIQEHAANARTVARQAIGGAKIGLIEARVVSQFAGLGDTCVKRLDRFATLRSAPFFEDSVTALRECDERCPRLPHHVRHRPNEAGLAEVSQIAGAWIGRAIAVVPEIGRRHHAKRPDSRQRANF